VNQRTLGGQWNLIGQLSLQTGDHSVVISDQASSGRVVADGVRVVALANPPGVIQADFISETRHSYAAPFDVTFESTSTGDISTYQWDFGDGSTNSSRTFITHTYSRAGTYNVKFTVNGPDGTSTQTKSGYIVIGSAAPPLRAEFSGNRQAGTVPLECTFSDLSSGSYSSVEWIFGDGTSSTERNPTHTYTTPGNYTVRLNLKNASGSVVETEIKTNFIVARLYDKSMDNVDYPKAHYRSKTIIFRKGLEISKDQLRYSRLYYEGCNSGNYFLDTFNHGIVFYTLNTATGMAYGTYVRNYVQGKSNQQIWEAMQKIEPVYDYYDFSKKPSQQ
jgi:PKD repeat protein